MLDVMEREEFAEQLLAYDSKDPKIFHFLAMTQMRSSHPRVWWEANGRPILVVKKVAIRILSQPCSASCCERGWSGFEAAQTKKRNQLSPEMLDDLVFIRMNSLMYLASKDLEMRDRKLINLEELRDLRDYADTEDPDVVVEEEDTFDLNNGEAGTAWLHLRFGIGQN